MGSSMRESIFADRIVEGLKNWHRMAKRNLDEKRSYSLSSPSTDRGASSRSSEVASLSSNSRKEKAVQLQIPTKREAGRRIIEEKKGSSLSSPSVQPFSFATAGVASSSNMSTSRWVHDFRYPSGRAELLEVQKLVEEIIQCGDSNLPYTGDMSSKLWGRNGKASSPRHQQ